MSAMKPFIKRIFDYWNIFSVMLLVEYAVAGGIVPGPNHLIYV